MKPFKKILLLCAAALALGAPPASSLDPGPSAPIVSQMVARILEQNHYNHHPLDAKTSKDMLREYLEMYDYNHMIFQKSDVSEFESRYGHTLAEKAKAGDVSAAYEIFDRLLKRLEEIQAHARELASSSMTFTAAESMALSRHEAPWPATAQESRDLWRRRIKYELLQEKLGKTKPEEIAKTVVLRYERLLRGYKEFDSTDVLQNYLTALAHAFDPHSDYMAAPQVENFNISMKLSLVGIGAVLRSEDGYAKIVSLVPGGPADASKRLKPNDKIVAVAQGDEPYVDAVGMKLDRVVQIVRGEKGTTVRLRIIPADAVDPSARVEVAIVRDEIKLTQQEARAKIIEMHGAAEQPVKIGVIDLPSFYADMQSTVRAKSTTRDVEKLLEALKKERIEGLIVDLRRNGGGSLSEAVSLTGLFIPEGPVVQVKDARGQVKIFRDAGEGSVYDGPLLVLTSRASASASEIFAAALQDYGRAVIVGQKSTFGKGTVQSINELSDYLPRAFASLRPGALKLTIQKFYRVSGGSTQRRGVVPDVRLPSVADAVDMTETSLENALPYDEIEPAPHPRAGAVDSRKLRELALASKARVAASQEFGYVREDIERYKKQKEQKILSLNEAKRLEEKRQDEAREEKRKKERAKRAADNLIASEITLESIDSGKPVIKSTSAVTTPVDEDVEGENDEKAPPAPDFELEESVRILDDLIGRTAIAASSRRSR